jgi:hypothetical protein
MCSAMPHLELNRFLAVYPFSTRYSVGPPIELMSPIAPESTPAMHPVIHGL